MSWHSTGFISTLTISNDDNFIESEDPTLLGYDIVVGKSFGTRYCSNRYPRISINSLLYNNRNQLLILKYALVYTIKLPKRFIRLMWTKTQILSGTWVILIRHLSKSTTANTSLNTRHYYVCESPSLRVNSNLLQILQMECSFRRKADSFFVTFVNSAWS